MLDADAEAGEQLGEVAAVLLLLVLGQHDQPAAVHDVLLDRVELLDGQDGAAQAGGALPALGGRMSDHEDVPRAQQGRGDRALGVRGDGVPETAQQSRGAGVAAVVGMPGIHRLGHVPPDGPRLAVRLVEQRPRESSHDKSSLNKTNDGKYTQYVRVLTHLLRPTRRLRGSEIPCVPVFGSVAPPRILSSGRTRLGGLGSGGLGSENSAPEHSAQRTRLRSTRLGPLLLRRERKRGPGGRAPRGRPPGRGVPALPRPRGTARQEGRVLAVAGEDGEQFVADVRCGDTGDLGMVVCGGDLDDVGGDHVHPGQTAQGISSSRLVRPPASGVPVPGACAGSITSMSTDT